MSTEGDIAKAFATGLEMLPGLIEAGEAIMGAIKSAHAGDAEAAHGQAMVANARLAVELAKASGLK